MKKTLHTLMMAFFAMTTIFSFTSCEDEHIAYTLEGCWSGKMYTTYQYHGYSYDVSRTEVCFDRNPYTSASGTGSWVDYFQGAGGRVSYIANHMEWKVINGTIFLYLLDEDVEMQIRNYRLSDNVFYGQVRASDGTWREFALNKIASPNYSGYNYGWNNSGFGYDYGYGPYYARKHGATDSTSVATDSIDTTEKPRRF